MTHSDFVAFADAVLTLARELELRHAEEPDVAQLPVRARTVLRFIDLHPDSSPSAIAAATGFHRSNVSAVLRALEAQGLVERKPDPDDARGAVIRSTRRAEENLQALHRVWESALSGVGIEGMNVDGVAATLRMLADALSHGRGAVAL